MPEEKIEKIKTLNSPVLFVWPKQDQWINKDMVSKFENNMKTADKKLTVEAYEADHAFANPCNPKYSKTFADDAFNKAIEFIKINLK
jgi:carboxymethylenebutenolidase